MGESILNAYHQQRLILLPRTSASEDAEIHSGISVYSGGGPRQYHEEIRTVPQQVHRLGQNTKAKPSVTTIKPAFKVAGHLIKEWVSSRKHCLQNSFFFVVML